MNESLEQELKRALCRKEPPEGFADRVVASLPNPAGSARSSFWMAAVAAAIVIVLLLSGLERTRQRHAAEARDTERQVAFAFALAAEKLEHINVNLEKSSAAVKLPNGQERRYE